MKPLGDVHYTPRTDISETLEAPHAPLRAADPKKLVVTGGTPETVATAGVVAKKVAATLGNSTPTANNLSHTIRKVNATPFHELHLSNFITNPNINGLQSTRTISINSINMPFKINYSNTRDPKSGLQTIKIHCELGQEPSTHTREVHIVQDQTGKYIIKTLPSFWSDDFNMSAIHQLGLKLHQLLAYLTTSLGIKASYEDIVRK